MSEGYGESYPLLVILGPTASGKTRLAARVAFHLGSEIISADSRQVYRRMNLGTGKDYEDYLVGNGRIPVHLIDIRDPGEKYTLFDYQKDFLNAWKKIHSKKIIPIVCGGSGLYIEAVIRNYRLLNVPVNYDLRRQWEHKTEEELAGMLASIAPLHNKTDIETRKRLIRALEIAVFQKEHPEMPGLLPPFDVLVIGVCYERNTERARITERLQHRLNQGMVQEVEQLLAEGISPDDLMYYGLEYKWITLYILKKISYEEMVRKLMVAIHQFAKRQRTYFRRMERNGIAIHWLKGEDGEEMNVQKICELTRRKWNMPFSENPVGNRD